MRITDCLFSPGLTGFYFDDQRAIKAGAEPDGCAYRGVALTPGFDAIRIAGESVSVQLILEDGTVAYGDCAAIQYSGAGGRDPVFLARKYIPHATTAAVTTRQSATTAIRGRPGSGRIR